VLQSPSKKPTPQCSPAKGQCRRHVCCPAIASCASQAAEAEHAALDKRKRVGALHLIMGPMFAGKTTALLQKVKEAEADSSRVAVITNALDTRYGTNVCATHTGISRPAVAVSQLLPLLSKETSPFDLSNIDAIAIDESQFFPDLKEFCVRAVEEKGMTVFAAGLNGDFKRELFGDIVKLIPFADSVHFLRARCSFCEHPASFTLRLVSSESQQLVGGNEAYQPVCREHYRVLNNSKTPV
jgi:thymidine kinase